MNKLIIDSATNLLFVGLIKEGKHYIKTRVGKNDNAAYVVNYIKELLSEHNLTINDINEIITGIGPGSYTGIRVSVVVSKTLAYSLKIPLKQISSLKLLSSGIKGEVQAVIDARRGYVFAHKHDAGKTIKDDHYVLREQLKEPLYELTVETVNVDLNIIDSNSELVNDVLLLEPNYLRKTEAENNYDQTSQNKWY